MKKKKSLVIVIALFVIITLITVISEVIAADISTYLNIYNDKSTYLKGMGSSKSEFLGKTVGAPSQNDFRDYIKNSNYPGLWCLADRQTNTNPSMLAIAGIIEIRKNFRSNIYKDIFF